METAEHSALVSTILDLDAEIAALEEKRKVAADALIALGEGEYLDKTGERRLLVIVPSAPKPTFELYPKKALEDFCEKAGVKKATNEQVAAFFEAREAGARKLAGIAFGELFNRLVTYSPVKGFADIVPKLLTPAKARNLLDFCRVHGEAAKAHIKK
jgi:hypothetical protein